MPKIEQSDANGARFFKVKNQSGEVEGFGISSLTNDNQLKVDTIQVIPGARKKGVGGAILGAIIGWGKAKGARKITGEFFPEYRGGKSEEELREFYKKRGIHVDEKGNLIGKID